MPLFTNPDPFLIELEVEEAYEYMKDNKIEDINHAWLRLFLREPSDSEVDALIKRMQEGGPVQMQNILFTRQTNEIADAYRYHHGSFFSIRKANKICKVLFGRLIGLHEALEVKELIKEPEPYQINDFYKRIAKQVELIQNQRPNKKLEEVYQELVLRPPYRFEIQYHNENV